MMEITKGICIDQANYAAAAFQQALKDAGVEDKSLEQPDGSDSIKYGDLVIDLYKVFLKYECPEEYAKLMKARNDDWKTDVILGLH